MVIYYSEKPISKGIAISMVFTLGLSTACFVHLSRKYGDNPIRYSFTRAMSRMAGRYANSTLFLPVRSTLLNMYIKKFNVDTTEIEEPMSQFTSFQQFFTRKIKKQTRPITDYTNNSILSPADSRVLIYGDVKNGKIECVKGVTYTVDELLTGNNDKLQSLANSNLKYIVLYLSPGDYHHYHCPINATFTDRIYIPGYLEPVKPSYIAKHKVAH